MISIEWKTVKKKIKKLIPTSNNPRILTQKQYEDLKKSLIKFNLAEIPAINVDNTILAGHQRLKVLAEIKGFDYEIDVRVPNRQLTNKEAIEYLIRSNKNTGDWNFDLLESEFDKSDLIDWGFDEDEFNFEEDSEEFEEDNHEIPKNIKTDIILGDLFEIGDNRLLCGDSTNSDHVERLMDKKESNLMVTDPPYGVNYNPEWRDDADLGVGERSKGKVPNDDQIDWSEAYSLFKGNVCYVWHDAKYSHLVSNNLENLNFETVSQIIWAKQHFVLSRGNYHWQHEPCLYVVKKGCNHNWQGARDQSTLWNIKNNNSFGNSNKEENFGHGTQKPIECMARPIKNNSSKGDIIYDPFLGSGTTMMAAQQLKRKCFGLEISPQYCHAILDRIKKSFPDLIIKKNGVVYNY